MPSRRKLQEVKEENMSTTHQNTSYSFNDLKSRLASHLVLSEDEAYDPARQPSTWLRAAVLYPLEEEVKSLDSPFTDENLLAFEDLPDLEGLFGRMSLSDLEDLPDFEDLLDPEEWGYAGTFLPATQSRRRSLCRSKAPRPNEHSKSYCFRAGKPSHRAAL
jgi:hypothetical protein